MFNHINVILKLLIFYFALLLSSRLRVIVGRGKEMQVTINIVFSFLLVIALFLMGLEIDLKIIWSVLKKPIGPAIGFVSQFVFMPLCAYGLAKAFLLHRKYHRI